MKLVRAVLTFASATCLCVGIASAQQKPTEKKMPAEKPGMDMPKPGPEMAKFKAFVGTWNTVEKHEASELGPAGEGKGTATIKEGPGGFSHVEDYKSTGPMGAFSGHAVHAWDPEARAYKSYWTDSMTPGVMVSTCNWEGKDFVCQGEMNMMGKKTKTKGTITNITPTSMTLTMEGSSAGAPMKKMMTITYTKAGAKTTTY